MKFHNIILLLFAFPLFSYSQIFGEDEVYLKGDYTEATFNGGGLEKFNAYIQKEFDFSKVTNAGKLEATFTINKDGALKNIRITSVLDDESAMELIRVLQKSPLWKPAKRGGNPITIDIKFPMIFKNSNQK